jgi:hypothetical protein
MQKVASNRSDAKRKIFKDLLLSTIEGRRSVDLSKSFINILGDMTDQEMFLFAKFYLINQGATDPSTVEKKRKFDKERVEQMGYEYKEFLIMVQNMIGKGILFDDGVGRYGTRPYEIVRISTLGVAFYDYVTCRS